MKNARANSALGQGKSPPAAVLAAVSDTCHVYTFFKGPHVAKARVLLVCFVGYTVFWAISSEMYT